MNTKINEADKFVMFMIFIVGPGLWLISGNWLAWPIVVIVGLAYGCGVSAKVVRQQRRHVQDGETVRAFDRNGDEWNGC